MRKPDESLPIYQPADLNPKLVDSSLQAKTKAHRIASFRLINQLGDTITNERFAGKIYVADFFFTTCPSICPAMSANMARIQEAFQGDERVMLLSHSVTPELDSVPVLRDYAERYAADARVWHLTTGDKKHIYELARKSYFAVLDEGDGGAQDFIHTENFVLVDTRGRLRGFYDGTNAEAVDKCIQDINKLLKEEFESVG